LKIKFDKHNNQNPNEKNPILSVQIQKQKKMNEIGKNKIMYLDNQASS
jgi:hypothetical protein